MYNAPVALDGFPSFLNKGKESDGSCSDSVRVEYDSRSSSHEDFDEYLQLRNGNMMKATERQRRMLRDRSSARITNIRVPDTYFDQIGSVLKRSLYSRNEVQCEELASDAVRNRAAMDAADQAFLDRGTLQAPSPRRSPQSPSSYDMKAAFDNFIYATKEDVPQTKHAAKRDVLSEDTLDEIRSFVDHYNEQEHNTQVSSINDTEFVEADNPIPTHRTVSRSNKEKRKGIPKESSGRQGYSLAERRKQSRSLRSAVENSNRKSDTSASLGQKKQKARLRSGSEFRHSESENSLKHEIRKTENKQKIRTSKDSDALAPERKHGSVGRALRSSDSDRTIGADRRSDASARQLRVADRHRTPLSVPRPRGRQPRSSEDLESADASLTEDRSATDVTPPPDRRRWTATGRAATAASLPRVQAATAVTDARLAGKELEGGALERRKTKKGKRQAAGGPMHSLLRAEARARARTSSDHVAPSTGKGGDRSKPGAGKDSAGAVPMLLWSVDSRAHAKKKAAKKSRASKGGGGGAPLALLMNTRAAGDASRHSASCSESADETQELRSSSPFPDDAPARSTPNPRHRPPPPPPPPGLARAANRKPFR